tara:strand:+ start:4946 stop:5149 length:204 start_codon:yes stop_codon:yes gene_type:complete
MFYASVFFCWVAFEGPQCLVAQDTEGPYVEREQCETRLREMEFTIHSQIPMSTVRAKLCEQLKEGNV